MFATGRPIAPFAIAASALALTVGAADPAVAQEPAAACALTSLQETAGNTATPAPAAAEQAAWLATELVDACSGETFTLAGFAGKTVFLHPMATW